MKFIETLKRSLDTKQTNLCVGLDSRYDRIPDEVKRGKSLTQAVVAFNTAIIEATHDLAASYKMNVAFYAGFGAKGLDALAKTNAYIKSTYTDIPTIADCKRSEMGESVAMISHEIYDWLGFDCVMVTPWFGFDTVSGYLKDERHGVCVYVHDSNPTAAEFQDLELAGGGRVYEEVTRRVCGVWNTSGNIFIEAGATYPVQLRRVREIAGDGMPMLVAGVGAQGGKPEVLRGLFGTGGNRLMVNSSRGIIFAGEGNPDYFRGVREAAEKTVSEIQAIKNG